MQNINKTIDICVVSTLRLSLLKKTIGSFFENIKYSGGEYNFIVNIDLQPKPKRLFNLSHIVFHMGFLFGAYTKPTKIIIGEGNFCSAVQNLWKNTTSDFVFHLEDDWIFLKEINLNKCVQLMEKTNIDYMRFPKLRAEHVGILHKVAFQPSLWRGDTVRKIALLLDTTKDPEKQCRPGQGNKELDKVLIDMKNKGFPDYGTEPCCKDIGREWRKKRGIDKKNGKWIYNHD